MDFVHLIGAEDVRSAASSIRQAAHDMQQAATTISEALSQHQRYMDQWLNDFRAIALDKEVPR